MDGTSVKWREDFMNKGFVILWMLFNHVLDDFFLQGILASMKQVSWWRENSPDRMYKYDFIMALFMHALSWTFMIMLPLAAYSSFVVNDVFMMLFLGNIILHMGIDDAKANAKTINLIQDQIFHLVMIFASAFLFLI